MGSAIFEKLSEIVDPYFYLKLAIIEMAEKLITEDKTLLALLIDGAYSHLLDVRHRSILALAKLVNTKIELGLKQQITQATQLLLNTWHKRLNTLNETDKALKQLHLFIPLIHALGFTEIIAHVLHAKLKEPSSNRAAIEELLNRLEQTDLIKSYQPLDDKPPPNTALFAFEVAKLQPNALQAPADIKTIEGEVNTLIQKLADQESNDPALLAALKEKLQNPDATIRCTTLIALKKLKKFHPAMMSALFGMLQDEDDEVRCTTINIFEELAEPDKSVVTALLRMLQDQKGKVRQAVIVALSKLTEPSEQVLTILRSILQDKKSDAQDAVISVLKNLNNPGEAIVKILLDLLQHKELEMQRFAISALGNIKKPSKAVVMLLIEQLQHKTLAVRNAVIESLSHINNPNYEVAKILIELLPNKWQAALSALSNFKNPNEAVMQALIEILHDKQSRAWHAVVLALNHLSFSNPSEAVVKRLIELLQHKESKVRSAAVSALGRLSNPSEAVMKILIELLQHKESDIRRAAVSALGRLSNPNEAVVKVLFERLLDDTAEIQKETVLAFGNRKKNAIKENHVKHLLLTTNAVSLIKLYKYLQKMLDDSSWLIRQAAIQLLCQFNLSDEEKVAIFLGKLNDDDNDVREATIDALGQIKNPNYTIVKAITIKLEDSMFNVRQAAKEVLKIWNERPAGDVLEAMQELKPQLYTDEFGYYPLFRRSPTPQPAALAAAAQSNVQPEKQEDVKAAGKPNLKDDKKPPAQSTLKQLPKNPGNYLTM